MGAIGAHLDFFIRILSFTDCKDQIISNIFTEGCIGGIGAIKNIKETFTIVAPNENIDQVMSLIANHFGVNDIAYSRANISGPKVITKDKEELCTKILERNYYDKKLHDYIKTHWEDWIKEHIESISDNISQEKEYTVLSHSFYQSKTITYLNLDQIDKINLEQNEELVGIISPYPW